MMTRVFDYDHYKDYLKAQVKEHAQTVGYKARLARAAGCPQSLISQVLHQHIDLSLDHAFGLAKHWGLDETESEHFLELVQLARAGTPALRHHLLLRIKDRKDRVNDLTERFKQPKLESTQAEWVYYTQWHLSAIHMLLTIPMFRTEQAVATRLQLPPDVVRDALVSLDAMGLAERSSVTQWRVTRKSVHLSKQSPASPTNHLIWRQKSMERVLRNSEKDLFYSGQHTLSVQDAAKLRNLFLEAIERARAVIAPSAEETLVGLNLDFFEI